MIIPAIKYEALLQQHNTPKARITRESILRFIKSHWDIPYYKLTLEKHSGTWHWAGHISHFFYQKNTHVAKFHDLSLQEWLTLFSGEYQKVLNKYNMDSATFIDTFITIDQRTNS